ncbi:MAG: diguanylate cyclase [Eubacteriales bacterium]|nr:diguanylate cyclase [Eubacteriales bacterium]
MQQFQLFRYLKRWRYLIALVILVGSALFYFYAASNQTYTASITIRYTNAGAVDGLRPDGTEIDPTEIYSSNIINRIREKLGWDSSTESIRSSCATAPVISEDELTRKEAILQDGDEYIYHPTDYKVFYVADSSSDADTAKMVLSYLIDEYVTSYVEKYVSVASLPNNMDVVAQSDYDYIQKIDLFMNTVTNIMVNLDGKQDLYPDFRSAKTGYCFSDLYAIYEYVYENCIPYLYAMTLDNALSQNADVLAKTYRERLADYDLQTTNIEEQLTYIDHIIQSFGDKLTAKIQESNSVATDNNSTIATNVLPNVYGYNDDVRSSNETTYDKLLYERIDYELSLIDTKLNMERTQDLLKIFDDAASTTNDYLAASIQGTGALLETLYPILNDTCEEFNGYLAMQNIQVLSNIKVSEGINIQLYLLLAIFVFFVFGCIGTVILGRGEDILHYMIYNDHKTGLPNRVGCDQEIAKYADHILNDRFCCAVVRINNLDMLSQEQGFAVGDAVLQQISSLLKQIGNDMGFIGYNGAGSFLCLFPDCTESRIEALNDQLQESVHKLNLSNESYQIEVASAYAQTDRDQIFNIRQLMRAVYERVRNERRIIK